MNLQVSALYKLINGDVCDAFIEVLSTLEIKFTQTCKGLASAAAVSLCILNSVPYTDAELAQTHSRIPIPNRRPTPFY